MNGPHASEKSLLAGPARPGPAAVAPFKPLLQAACGFAFEHEREAALAEALARRMAATQTASLDAYRTLLTGSADEMGRLVELLTVNETYFLREPAALDLVTGKIVPEILAARPGGVARLLSAGCSTGEEPYSLALLLRERLGPDWQRLCQVAGVDIDTAALAAARRAVYGKSSFRGMDQALRDRYFTPCPEGGWRLAAPVRDAVRLAPANLLTGGLATLLRDQDVILYRNVSIYFPPAVQREVFRRLADCLRDGGHLLVGATETLHHDLGLLTLVERDGLYLYRKGDGGRSRTPGRAAKPAASPLPAVGRTGPGTRPGTRQPAAPAPSAPPTAPTGTGPGQPRRQAAARPGPEARDLDGLLAQALALSRERRPDEALALVDRALEKDGRCASAHALKAGLLLGLGRTAEAAAACRLALARDPLCLEATLILGLAALSRDEAEQALVHLREAICIDPDCWPAHFHTAEIMFSRGERKRARGAYATALRLLAGAPDAGRPPRRFPLTYNADQFMAICRHKLALLAHKG